MRALIRLISYGLGLGLALGTGQTLALPIQPGVDLFHTPDGNGSCGQNGGTTSCLDLSGLGVGLVPMQSNPFKNLDPSLWRLGNTDTLVLRTGSLGDGETGTIDAEIIGLSLKSVTPVSISGSPFDVFLIINQELEKVNPDGSPLAGGDGDGICESGEECKPLLTDIDVTGEDSPGTLDILSHTDEGGTFSSFFDLFVDIYLCTPGSGISLACTHQTGTDTLASSGITNVWSHDIPPGDGYPLNPHKGRDPLVTGDPMFFTSGDFFPGFDPLLGRGSVQHQGPHPQVDPAIPEPATLALFGTGLGLLGWRRRRA